MHWHIRNSGLTSIWIDPCRPCRHECGKVFFYGGIEANHGSTTLRIARGALAWKVSLLIIVFCASAHLSAAQGWTYLGCISPVGRVESIVQPAGDPSVLLASALYDYPNPGTGGIFRHSADDTVWQQVALPNLMISSIEQFDNYPGILFVPTNRGVYRSTDNGNTWALFPTVTYWPDFPFQFQISPSDPNLWALGLSNDTFSDGILFVTADSGATWHRVYTTLASNLTFSRHLPQVVYMSYDNYFRRFWIADSTMEELYNPGWIGLHEIVVHPTQPWVYVLWTDRLLRYNELTNEMIFHSISDTAEFTSSMVWDPRGGLWVSSHNSIYHVSEDMTQWNLIPIPVSGSVATLMMANDTMLIATATNLQSTYVYAYRTTVSVPNRQPSRRDLKISVFPNPCYDQVTFQSPLPAIFEIYNLLGQRVGSLTTTEAASTRALSLTNLTSGYYFYRARTLRGAVPELITGCFQVLK
jgi:hypothetical protein